MDAAAELTTQLRRLCGEDIDGDQIVAGLTRLATALTTEVPSLVAASIVLVRSGIAIPVSIRVGDGSPTVVRASLAVPLGSGEPGGVLIMRAGEAGAFLLLADDLERHLPPGSPAGELDGHLTLPASGAEWLATSLVDFDAVNQAIGVLVESGWPPAEAAAELHRRAVATAAPLAAAGRTLVASVHRAGPSAAGLGQVDSDEPTGAQ